MLKKGIRNLGVRDKRSNLIGLINDRNILQLLLSPRLRKSASINQMNINKDQDRKNGNEKIITKIKIENNLQINSGLEIKEDTLIKNAAKLLSDRKKSIFNYRRKRQDNNTLGHSYERMFYEK